MTPEHVCPGPGLPPARAQAAWAGTALGGPGRGGGGRAASGVHVRLRVSSPFHGHTQGPPLPGHVTQKLVKSLAEKTGPRTGQGPPWAAPEPSTESAGTFPPGLSAQLAGMETWEGHRAPPRLGEKQIKVSIAAAGLHAPARACPGGTAAG